MANALSRNSSDNLESKIPGFEVIRDILIYRLKSFEAKRRPAAIEPTSLALASPPRHRTHSMGVSDRQLKIELLSPGTDFKTGSFGVESVGKSLEPLGNPSFFDS